MKEMYISKLSEYMQIENNLCCENLIWSASMKKRYSQDWMELEDMWKGNSDLIITRQLKILD